MIVKTALPHWACGDTEIQLASIVFSWSKVHLLQKFSWVWGFFLIQVSCLTCSYPTFCSKINAELHMSHCSWCGAQRLVSWHSKSLTCPGLTDTSTWSFGVCVHSDMRLCHWGLLSLKTFKRQAVSIIKMMYVLNSEFPPPPSHLSATEDAVNLCTHTKRWCVPSGCPPGTYLLAWGCKGSGCKRVCVHTHTNKDAQTSHLAGFSAPLSHPGDTALQLPKVKAGA